MLGFVYLKKLKVQSQLALFVFCLFRKCGYSLDLVMGEPWKRAGKSREHSYFLSFVCSLYLYLHIAYFNPSTAFPLFEYITALIEFLINLFLWIWYFAINKYSVVYISLWFYESCGKSYFINPIMRLKLIREELHNNLIFTNCKYCSYLKCSCTSAGGGKK